MKKIICPTVLATSEAEFAAQMRTVGSLSPRLQIDLMDGEFALPRSVELDKVWWPPSASADIHLMYQHPMNYLEKLLHLKPNMVIIHYEAQVDHMHFAAELHREGIKAGLAILPATRVSVVEDLLTSFDHLLIFSGHLGHFGGKIDLSLLPKAQEAKSHHPDLEIGWDGGINDQNAEQLVEGGVDVLNVGGFIQSNPGPEVTYSTLCKLVNN
jgi:ribulose-phosphate 3-epimerase